LGKGGTSDIPSDPVFAYDLDSPSSTRRRLAFLAQYLREAFQLLDRQGVENAFSEGLRSAPTSKAETVVTD
jgi:hypothetical protein